MCAIGQIFIRVNGQILKIILASGHTACRADQCDQIWQNFATLAKFLSLWQVSEGLFNVWQNCEPHFGNFLMLLGKRSLL